MGKPGRRASKRSLPRARGGAPSEFGSQPVRLYRRSRHPAGTKIPLPLCAGGPVRSSERQEPHRPLTHGPNPYDSTGDEITLDEVERIRI